MPEQKRLCVVVPYRDRAEHLRRFIPHIFAYFERDKCDRTIPFKIAVIEQLDDAPFNRGAVKNVGFLLHEDSFDYFAFHDVDYLPLWTDYSYPDRPARMAWYGAEFKRQQPGSTKGFAMGRDTFFGGVVLFRREHFRAVNGYANDYIGWGAEDRDLRERCLAHGFRIDHRDGTYHQIDHTHEGIGPDGRHFDTTKRNLALFERRKTSYHIQKDYLENGLDQLGYEVCDRSFGRTAEGSEMTNFEIIRVRFSLAPS